MADRTKAPTPLAALAAGLPETRERPYLFGAPSIAEFRSAVSRCRTTRLALKREAKAPPVPSVAPGGNWRTAGAGLALLTRQAE